MLDEVFDAELIARVSEVKPTSLLEALKAIDFIGAEVFREKVSILKSVLGTHVVSFAFAADPVFFALAVDKIKGIQKEDLALILEMMKNEFGADSVSVALSDDIGGFACVVDAFDTLGIERTAALLAFLKAEFEEGVLSSALSREPGRFALAIEMINALGTHIFQSAAAYLRNTFSDTIVSCAAEKSFHGVVDTVLAVHTLGLETMNYIEEILGKDAMGLAFSNNPYHFVDALRSIYALGFYSLKKVTAILGKDAVVATFIYATKECANVLSSISTLGFTDMMKVAAVFGPEALSARFSRDPKSFGHWLQSMHEMGIDMFLEIVDDLDREWGPGSALRALTDDNRFIHIGRFQAQDVKEVLRNRLHCLPDTRPLAVVVYPAGSWNGVFSSQKEVFQSLIQKGYRLVYQEIATIPAMISAFIRATEHERAQVVIIAGYEIDKTLAFEERASTAATDASFALDAEVGKYLRDAGIAEHLAAESTVVLVGYSPGAVPAFEVKGMDALSKMFAGEILSVSLCARCSFELWYEQKKIVRAVVIDQSAALESMNKNSIHRDYQSS